MLSLLALAQYVSVLHVFQQLALTWSWWLVLRMNPGGDAWFAAALQALYNVTTYGYFAYKRNKRPTLRAQRRITHFLMGLLALSVGAAPARAARPRRGPSPHARALCRAPLRSGAQAVHTLWVLASGSAPALLALVDLLVMGSLLLLFGNYRYHKYLKPFEAVLHERRASGAAAADDRPHSPAAGGAGVPPPSPPPPRHVSSMGGGGCLEVAGLCPKLVVSFDSSGWLYLYHFGVCRFFQLHVLHEMQPERFAFSGSSGGALAATALACDVPIDDLVDEILAVCWPWCRKSPFAMCPAVEYALHKFLPDGGGARNGADGVAPRAQARQRPPAQPTPYQPTHPPTWRRARARVGQVLGAAAATRHAADADAAVAARRRDLAL